MKKLPWVKEITRDLFDLYNQPLLGSFPFSWEEFSQKIGKDLQIDSLSVEPESLSWETKENLLLSTGDHSQVLSFQADPLDGEIFWLMEQREIAKLVNLFTAQKSHDIGFSSEILQEGYYHYLVTLALEVISSHPLFASLSISMREHNTLPETLLVREIKITYKGKSVYGRVALSPVMQKSWVSFIQNNPPAPSTWEDKLPIPLRLVIAKMMVSKEEDWKVGSYLLLPKSDYDFLSKRGKLTLFAHTFPLAELDAEEGRALITTLQMHEDAIMEENETTLETLPIEISVELARFHLPLNKITELEEGATLELPPVGEKVSLLANGKKIASGELLYVGDQLAVRLEEISK